MAVFGVKTFLQIVHPSILQLIVWGILEDVPTLYSWLVAGQIGDFNSQGLIGYALWPFIALIVGIFLSQRTNQPRLMLVPAFTVVGSRYKYLINSMFNPVFGV